MIVDRHPAVLDVLPPPYRPLFDRLVTVAEADERIRALWLSGSLARGTADAGSDLDVLLAVRDADHQAFIADWRRCGRSRFAVGNRLGGKHLAVAHSLDTVPSCCHAMITFIGKMPVWIIGPGTTYHGTRQ